MLGITLFTVLPPNLSLLRCIGNRYFLVVGPKMCLTAVMWECVANVEKGKWVLESFETIETWGNLYWQTELTCKVHVVRVAQDSSRYDIVLI